MAPNIRFEDVIISMVDDGTLRVLPDGSVWKGQSRVDSLKPSGYRQVRVMRNTVRYAMFAHRLVWTAFNQRIPDGLVINHINGKKSDNRPCNLECVTHSANLSHAHRIGLVNQFGQQNPAAKISDTDVAVIRELYARGQVTQAHLAAEYGVKHQSISKIVKGHRRVKQFGPVIDVDARSLVTQEHDTKGQFTGRLLGNSARQSSPGGAL